jgi:plasmid stabilization system protein ParE
MKLRISIRPQAFIELAEATEWYESRAKGLVADFLREFDDALEKIERNPFGYQVLFGNVRRAFMRRFPYCVMYTVDLDEIVVISCFHARRDPAGRAQ